ncbi:hypothetical protein ACH5RR_034464 [Cinchona calisaya]|uniref:Uncharacterized protein n=1 Tax=Cinchona calisaya TaxID=153742 RepID=A0ABD2YC97_9GENT
MTFRVEPDLDALGAVGDAGWYNVRACLWAADFGATKKRTKGNLHLHDFIIPLEENKASFYTSFESGFTELQIGFKANSSEYVISNDLSQEVEMVKELSTLIGIIKDEGRKPEKK